MWAGDALNQRRSLKGTENEERMDAVDVGQGETRRQRDGYRSEGRFWKRSCFEQATLQALLAAAGQAINELVEAARRCSTCRSGGDW